MLFPRKYFAASLLACQVFTAPAWALGLGDFDVRSRLFQPLAASIDLQGANKNDLQQMSVRFGSAEEYLQAGLQRPLLLSRLTLSTGVGPDGTPQIELRSVRSLSEPVFDLLISVETPDREIRRVYSVLLDPPNWSDEETAQVTTAKSTVPEITSTAIKSVDNAVSDGNVNKPRPLINGDQYGPVPRGDSLSAIAERTLYNGSVSINQMMLAYLRMNPEAFNRGNISGLQSGVMLTIPTEEEAQRLSSESAAAQAAAHWTAWKSGATLVVDAGSSGQQSDAKQISASNGEQAESVGVSMRILPPSEEQARAGTAVPNSDTAGAAGTQVATSDVAAEPVQRSASSEVDVESLRNEIRFQSERLSDFERMLELRDEQIASVREAIARREASLQSQQELLMAQSEQINQLVEELKAKRDETPNTVLSEKTLLAIAIALIVALPGVLGLGWFMYRMGARKSASIAAGTPKTDDAANEQTQQQVLPVAEADSPAKVESALDRAARERRHANFQLSKPLPAPVVEELDQTQMIEDNLNETMRETGRATGKSSPAVVPAIADVTKPVAPSQNTSIEEVLSEVEVCIAYGLHQQAEELLIGAVVQRPDDPEFRIKLLEVLLMMGKFEDFEARATESRWMIDDVTWKSIKDFAIRLGASSSFFRDLEDSAPRRRDSSEDDEETDFYLDGDQTVRDINDTLVDDDQTLTDDTVRYEDAEAADTISLDDDSEVYEDTISLDDETVRYDEADTVAFEDSDATYDEEGDFLEDDLFDVEPADNTVKFPGKR